MRLRTTEHQKKFWKNRKMDWKQSYQNWDHPHRNVITAILKAINWGSLIEVGCAAGANLINIIKNIPKRQVGGVDVNAEAIEVAQKSLPGGLFKVNSGDDIMLSDKATDVVLSDMTLIYVGPTQIDRYIKEIKRIARNYVILCEFHSTSWWNRLALRFNEGYNAYNYRKLLEKHGFYDILEYKLQDADWPEADGKGHEPQKTFGYIFLAKVPKR